MSNRNTLIIVACVFLILFLLGRSFYEKKEINTCQWYEDYRFNSKEPYGAWLFYEMILDRYGEENVFKNTIDTNITQIDTSGFTYILLSSNYKSDEELDKILELAKYGNEVLLIGETLYSKLTGVYRHAEIDKVVTDTVFNMYFSDGTELQYKNFYNTIKKASQFTPFTVDNTGRINFESIGMVSDTTTFFYKKTTYDGTYYHHTAPFLFSNIASKQDFYLTHFNKVFDNFKHDKVILDCAYYFAEREYEYNDRSPIQYILAEKSLRWAYYTFIFTTISFLFFRGKRKQRIIPVLEKNENTSIQYVDTLSELFMQQDQNDKLVPHLEAIFYQRIKQKYYLLPENENFVNLLSRKSRIPEKNIETLINNFKTGSSGYHFSDDQLIMLHRRLEEFYKNAE